MKGELSAPGNHIRIYQEYDTFLNIKHTFEGDRGSLFELSVLLCAKNARTFPENLPSHSRTDDISPSVPPDAASPCSGLDQPIPARFSLEWMYSLHSALAWDTSSLSVGERSNTSEANTEERRNISMPPSPSSECAPHLTASTASLSGRPLFEPSPSAPSLC